MSLDVYLDTDVLQSAYRAGGIQVVCQHLDFLKGTNAKIFVTDVVAAELSGNTSGGAAILAEFEGRYLVISKHSYYTV